MNTCLLVNEDKPYFSRHPVLGAVLIVVGLGLFVIATYSLVTHTLLYPDDRLLAARFSALGKSLPGWLMAALIYFANFASIAPGVVCLIFCYRWLREKCDDRFTAILMSYGVGDLIFFLLALYFNRQRPSLPGLLKALPFPSFPSGHMIQTLTLLPLLLYLYLPRARSRGWRVAVVLLAVIYTLLVGIDRLLVNAHYLTDVLAGTGIGLFWGAAVLLGFEWYHRTHPTDRKRGRLREA